MSAIDASTIRALVSRRTGLLRHVRERRSAVDPFAITDTVGQLRSLGADDTWVSEINGGGHLTRTQSVAAAIGESIERYCLSLYDVDHLVEGDCGDVGPLACAPEELAFFLDEQYRAPGFCFRRFTPTSRIRWARGYSLLGKREVHVPASLVYVPYAYAPGEQALSFQMSPGTSCHRTREAATLRAILEIIERDSLTICWEAQASFPPVDIDQVQEVAARLSLASSTVELFAFDLTTDLAIPVVLTLAICGHAEPEVSIGIAAHIDGTTALAKSIEEAITSWRSSVALCREDRRSRSELLDELRVAPSFAGHALYHARRGSIRDFRFLLDAELPASPMRPHPATDDAARLAAVVARLAHCGQDAVLFDLSQPELRDLGFLVVRAVMPGLVRQTIGVVARHLANRRILDVPARLGLPARLRTAEALLRDHVPSP